MKKILMGRPKKKQRFLFQGKDSYSRILMTLMLCFGFIQFGYSQTTKSITGKVVSEKGDPLIGVYVKVIDTTVATITDNGGTFKLSVPENATLLISYLGCQDQQVVVGTKTHVDITLLEDVQSLSEVVVVGFGTQKKVNLTGSVAAINNKELELTKNQNAQNMLTGKVPGVRVVQKTSEPGEFNNMFDIRGFGTPLIVIDGVPRGSDSFSRLSPEEIESVSVLKDASAAVYGVKAANGVVLVTTKKGEAGKTKIAYNGYYGFQSPADLLMPVGSVERMTLFNEKSMRSIDNPRLTYSDEQINAYLSGAKVATDWYDATLNNSASQQQHTLSASGGTQTVNYFMNFGYSQQDGFFKSGDLNYDRYNLRGKVESQLTKRLKVSLNLNGILDKKYSPNTATWTVYKQLWQMVPDDAIYANGNTKYFQKGSSPSDVYNTVAFTDASVAGYRKNVNKIYQATGSFTYNIPYITGLDINGMYTYDNTIGDNSSYKQEYNEYNYNSVTGQYNGIARNGPTNLERRYGNAETRLGQLSLVYNRSFLAKHNVNALILFENSHSQSDNILASRQFSIPLPYLFAGESANQEGTADANGIYEYASQSYVGKLNYDFKGKYLAEFSFRYDGSSKFAPSQQWGFFPGGSVGWRISEESFIKDNLSFIQNLKVRVSYGKLGDDRAVDYQYVAGFDYPNTSGASYNNFPTGYVYNKLYQNALGFRPVPNPNITWYTSETLNFGVDGDLWNGLLGFSFDMYQRDRKGLLDYRISNIPGSFGSTMPQENLNSDRTKGMELEVRHRNRIGDFSYQVSGNIALTRSMWLSKEHANYGSSWDYFRNGMSNRYSDIWFGWGANGRYTSYGQIATSPIYTGNGTLPGDYIYEDWNNDGIIDDYDRHPIATTTNANAAAFQNKQNYPLLNFGLTLSAQYKAFDISMLLQGSGMSYIAYGEQLMAPLAWNGNALDLFMDRWHPADPKIDPFDRSTTWIPGYYSYGGTTPDDNSRFAIQDGTYLRMKSLELGYTFPSHILKGLGITNLRLYVNSYNLFTLTNVKGVDPERPSELYGYMYPLNRTVNFGVSLDF